MIGKIIYGQITWWNILFIKILFTITESFPFKQCSQKKKKTSLIILRLEYNFLDSIQFDIQYVQ